MPIIQGPVLVVDDSELIRETLLGILQEAGYEAIAAPDGLSAKTMIRENQFNVALVDLVLPDADGIDILKDLRTRSNEASVIMISGEGTYDAAVRALNAGAFAYLPKPINQDEVKASVRHAAARQILVREIRERREALERANISLMQTNAYLKELAEIKNKFVSMVSHELRTPLTSIRGFSETILAYYGMLPIDKVKSYLTIIQEESLRLSRLIEELLDLSKIQSGKLHIDYGFVDLKMLGESILQRMSVVRREVQLEPAWDGAPLDLVTDKDKLDQVLVNLLGNAIKYSPAGGRVRLAAQCRGDTVCVSVIDEGPGIAEEAREKIFEPFYRTSDDVNRRCPGTGLGLTITKGIVEALGGRIWVESEVGKGSVFTFVLPKERNRHDQAA